MVGVVGDAKADGVGGLAGKPNPRAVSAVGPGDVVIYHAYGDHMNISYDVEAANRANLPAEIVFYMTGDDNFVPPICHARLHFFMVNVQPPMGGGLSKSSLDGSEFERHMDSPAAFFEFAFGC